MNKILRSLLIVTMAGLSAANGMAAETVDTNEIAEGYVKLVLEVGLYDADYVDAYFGPAEWKPAEEAKEDQFPTQRLDAQADRLIGQLDRVGVGQFAGIESQRHAYLQKQLRSVRAKIDLLGGRKMSFDEESQALYDVVAPAFDEAALQRIREQLDALLPGEGDLYWRLNTYRARFSVSQIKLEEALQTAIAESRRLTLEHITLPDNEGFEMDFVYGKPWGASVAYRGDGQSLVQINSSAPFGIADVIAVAGHELYPGHHTHLTLLEKHLAQGKRWVEFSILPLNSPLALIAEGLAEYGCRDLLATDERLEFERTTLFPLLGAEPSEAKRYGQVMELKGRLDAVLVEAARRYLDGKMTRDETRLWLRQNYLVMPGGEEGLIRFIEQQRSYVVNYTVGRQLIKRYIEKRAGTDNARRWQLFHALASTPQTPSGLALADR